MTEFLKSVKERPIAALGITGIISFAAMAVSGWLFLDTRYVHAKEFKQYAAQQTAAVNSTRKFIVEDSLFRLELVPDAKRTDFERALIERYKRQLIELNEATRNGVIAK